PQSGSGTDRPCALEGTQRDRAWGQLKQNCVWVCVGGCVCVSVCVCVCVCLWRRGWFEVGGGTSDRDILHTELLRGSENLSMLLSPLNFCREPLLSPISSLCTHL